MNICETYAALLDPFADGELSPEEMLRVQEHLDGCPACRAYVDDALAIRAAFPGVEDTEVPEGFAEAVSAAIRAGAAPRKRRASPWIRTLAPLAACCAIVLLLTQGPLFRMGSSNGAYSGGSAAPTASNGTEAARDDAAPEEAEQDFAAAENHSMKSAQTYADLPQAVMDTGADKEESIDRNTYHRYGQADASPEVMEPTMTVGAGVSQESLTVDGSPLSNGEDEERVEYGDAVFAALVRLTQAQAGDALADYEGRPYSRDGITGTGYALEQADFQRILEELGRPFQGGLDPNRTTELCCIVVTD